MHLFLTDLLTDSQMTRTMTNFSKPLLCVTLIGGDRSESDDRPSQLFVSITHKHIDKALQYYKTLYSL